ncbi:hypothetical protein AB1K54_13885 [Microbacterium sp. BWT-B31]|uniref:hypothetical protein n=1 Tax=Microbacterium sp. BWT-B31 TaxID=3232072 RepID=UPI00352975EF
MPLGMPSTTTSSRRAPRFGGVLATVLAVGLAVTACTGSNPDDGIDGDFADDGCTSVVVATSSEKVNMLDALADAFKESPEHDALAECATVRPINVSSGDATRFLTAGGDWPDDNERRWPRAFMVGRAECRVVNGESAPDLGE